MKKKVAVKKRTYKKRVVAPIVAVDMDSPIYDGEQTGWSQFPGDKVGLPFRVVLFISGVTYEGEGKTMLTALSNMNIGVKLAGKAIFEAHYGELKSKLRATPFLLRRFI